MDKIEKNSVKKCDSHTSNECNTKKEKIVKMSDEEKAKIKDEKKQCDLEDINKGEIYKITSKTSGKSYIGQASKYVAGHMKWGSERRFQTHIYEAFNSAKDNCKALNNDIRYHGSKDFELEIIHDNVPLEDIDKMERNAIKEHKTLIPNGYNIRIGGSGKMGDEEKAQIKNATKYIYRRKEVDKDLPLFLSSRMREEKIVGYKVYFPVPEGTSIVKEFLRKNVKDSHDAALKYIEELKNTYDYESWKDNVAVVLIKDYKHTPKGKELTEEEKLKKYVEVKTKKAIAKLPKYINPIHTKNKRTGYYVEGVLDHTGQPHMRKDFWECKDIDDNLNAAKRYIKELEIKNKDAVFVENVPDDIKEFEKIYIKSKTQKRSQTTSNLPRYIAHVIVKGEKIGYQVNNFPVDDKKIKKKIKKKFCDTRQTMKEKYDKTLDFVRDLYKRKNLNNVANEGDIENDEDDENDEDEDDDKDVNDGNDDNDEDNKDENNDTDNKNNNNYDEDAISDLEEN